MNESNFHTSNFSTSKVIEAGDSMLLKSVFNWMFIGLAVTGVTSMLVLSSESALSFLFSTKLFIVLSIVELGLVFWLSARVMKMSTEKASIIFIAYSLLNGITLSPLALIYTGASLTKTFLLTSVIFGGMAVYGNTTKRDLTKMGSFLMMGLFGIIIASLANIFMKSPAVDFVVSGIGVLVFTGLAAFHVQKIKQISNHLVEGTADFKRYSIILALSLYLDFINLFIQLLRFFGDRRD